MESTIAHCDRLRKLLSAFFAARIAKLALSASLICVLTLMTVSAGQPSFLFTVCAILTPRVQTVLPGTSGTILFTCGSNPAFTVNRPGSAIPSFTLPEGYVRLMIVAHSSGSTSCGLGRVLVSGYEVSFSKTGKFDYCASYSDPPESGLLSFQLSWIKK